MIDDLNAMPLKRQLDQAQAALDAFEAGVTRKDLIARLKADSPMHPALWLGRLSLGLFSTFLVAALAWTVVIAFGVPVPKEAMQILEANAMLPGSVILGGLALCFLGVAAGLRELAAEIGSRRPLLKHESQVQQKLTSEVVRLKTALKVERRLSDTPAPAPQASWAVVG